MSTSQLWLHDILRAWEDAEESVRHAQDMIARARRRGIWHHGPGVDEGVTYGNAAMEAVNRAVNGWGKAYTQIGGAEEGELHSR